MADGCLPLYSLKIGYVADLSHCGVIIYPPRRLSLHLSFLIIKIIVFGNSVVMTEISICTLI